MANIVGILIMVSAVILAAVVIVSFFAVRRYIQKSMMNKYKDHG